VSTVNCLEMFVLFSHSGPQVRFQSSCRTNINSRPKAHQRSSYKVAPSTPEAGAEASSTTVQAPAGGAGVFATCWAVAVSGLVSSAGSRRSLWYASNSEAGSHTNGGGGGGPYADAPPYQRPSQGPGGSL
jgi:hypothetical protein